ncbi:hypothetical protein TSAR_002109 [Trichomalopsis sarcophagae]|uniref:Peptidase S1 domain-containing protein n=1 Tax=Trichomalopsis sarcophagae TaxID=543379 RepID=A0A232EYN3_9HYME|nr:hypothetical protein TSAR_002109 [Trichomalopsis sarcophagae]
MTFEKDATQHSVPERFYKHFVVLKSCAEPIINTEPSDPKNAAEKALFSDYPFIELSYKSGHFCGGLLVTKRHVVTAAHSFDTDEKKAHVRVLVGISNFYQEPEVIDVEGWTKYVDWPLRKLESPYHDIAVLKLKKEVTTPNVVLIPLYNKHYDKSDIHLESIEWGRTEKSNESPDLLKIPLKIVPRAKCEREFQDLLGDKYYIRMWKLCTRSPKKLYLGSGDSGGPLIYKENGVMKLFGVNEANCDRTCLMLNIC